MHSSNRVSARSGILIALILFSALCLNSGCNGADQSNAVPFSYSSYSDSGGTTTPTQQGSALKGTVVDDDSLVPLDNATVSIGAASTVTDSQGNYSFAGISSGKQTMTVTCEGYSPFSEQVQLVDGETATQDIALATTADDWLQENTTYNWQVEAVQADGKVIAGQIWNFTTESSRGVRSLEMKETIDTDQARKVADNFLAAEGQGRASIASVESINSASGTTVAYAFILNPAGYIIVPASRAAVLPPVLAYSFTSSFSTHRAASLQLVNMFRGDIARRLSALSEKAAIPASFLTKNRGMWDAYLSGRSVNTGSAKTVTGPLLKQDTWGQGDPYNGKCPIDSETKKLCITGCVATAYSQILNYWKYPTEFSFTSGDDYTTNRRKTAITASNANFTGIDYDDGMPDGETQAKICFAVGVLARMDYTSRLSLAGMVATGKKLTRFGYKDFRTKKFGVNDEIDTEPIKTDLTSTPGRPVFLAINKLDDNGNFGSGHAIVCDGYNDSTGKFHLNLGWESKSDGWYDLPSGMPSKYTNISGYVYNLVSPKKGIATSSISRSAIPGNPYPENGETRVALDEELIWDDCDNAVSYNCYLWKSDAQKPSAPTFTNLPCAAADLNYLEQK